jgi:SAM-dependent methyltransferase
MLSGLHGNESSGLKGFRVAEIENGRLIADLNHPLADKKLVLSATLEAPSEARGENPPGDINAEIFDTGPGMQARAGLTRTDFGRPSLRRQDESDDSIFYSRPRVVGHVDSTASSLLTLEYSRHIKPGMRILDLMAGSKSHLPPGCTAFGLGLNAEEMQANPNLHGYEVQDLNREFELPCGDNSFDAAVCSLSIEYLIDPWAVANDAARVLKPGAPLLLGFSNRWFPTKAAGFWPEMHEFERMGFVLDLFIESGEFVELRTVSYRGRPRPADDPYAGRMAHSDPVYVVSGRKRSG